MKPTTPDPQSVPETLEIERIFNATPDRVFDAFSTVDAMSQWFGPGDCNVVRGEIDFRVGGRYLLRVNTSEDGEVEVVGEYTTIQRPSRLAFTWRWQDNPAVNPSDSTVDITFAPHPEGTRLLLRQAGIENDDSRREHNYGWNAAFDNLANQFTSNQ